MNAPHREQSIPPKPVTFSGDLAKLPDVFCPYQGERVWLCWKWTWSGRKWTKPPVTCHGYGASSTNPATWCSYAEALAAVQAHKVDGIGIALAGLSGGEIALDLDDCRDPVSGQIEAWANELVIKSGSYAEVTVSGRGLRILGRGNVGPAHNSFALETGGLEIFAAGVGRYITVSGLELPGCWPHFSDIGELTSRLLANKGVLHPQTKHGGDRKAKGSSRQVGDMKDDRFTADAAEKTGTSERGRSEFFRNVNAAALASLDKWVPDLFPKAVFQPGTKAWRVSSENLGRDYEEDLSIHPEGIRDFGPEKAKTAIDLVMEHGGAADAVQAAKWLCEKCGLNPASLGWQEPSQRQSSSQPHAEPSSLWDPWREAAAPALRYGRPSRSPSVGFHFILPDSHRDLPLGGTSLTARPKR